MSNSVRKENSAEVTIVGLPISNFTRTIRMVCEEKRIMYNLDEARPQSDTAFKCHPLGRIPGLVHGDMLLGESSAIANYLDDRFPERALFPCDPVDRAKVDQWASVVGTAVDQAMIRNYIIPHLFPEAAAGDPRILIQSAIPIMQQQIGCLSAAVAASGYLAGPSLTYADLVLLPILAGIMKFPEGRSAMDGAAPLRDYFEHNSQRDSFVATDPF